jgi:hypothetical protein
VAPATKGEGGGGGEDRAPLGGQAADVEESAKQAQPPGAARNMRRAPAPEPDPAPASKPGLVATPEARLRGELAARRDELRRCFSDKAARKLTVKVEKGLLSIQVAGAPADAKGHACLERVLRQIPMADLTASAMIELGQ